MALSVQVQQRQRASRGVISLLEARSQKGDGLRLYLASVNKPGSPVIDGAAFLRSLGEAIDVEQQSLEAADLAHEDELADDEEPKRERSLAMRALYQETVQFRKEVVGLYGATGIATLGMTGSTPQEPSLLARFVSGLLLRLQNPPANLQAKSTRATLDWAQAASVLAPLVERLQAAIKKTDAEAAEAKVTQDARNLALENWQARVPLLVSLARTTLRLAGDEEGASRLRLRLPTRNNTAAEDLDEAEFPEEIAAE